MLDDERFPDVLEADEPDLVVWSSLWPRRPDARIRLELPRDPSGHGTALRWALLVEEPPPDASLLGHMRRRINELINASLRSTFGQESAAVVGLAAAERCLLMGEPRWPDRASGMSQQRSTILVSAGGDHTK